MDALAKATESAEESLGNLRTVRAFSKELSEIYRYQRSVYDAFKLGRTVRHLRLAICIFVVLTPLMLMGATLDGYR
eukprot:COSAG02_NODE_11390_length_1733_cov_1.320685_2_plen_76_part_00